MPNSSAESALKPQNTRTSGFFSPPKVGAPVLTIDGASDATIGGFAQMPIVPQSQAYKSFWPNKECVMSSAANSLMQTVIPGDFAMPAQVMPLGVLTASIAHEVNQPLSGIITNASTCLRMLASAPPHI